MAPKLEGYRVLDLGQYLAGAEVTRMLALRLGEHDRPVPRDLFGYGDEHIDDLAARGVLRSVGG